MIALFERGETIPALLATPTAPTGHVDAATLVERMERLAGTEPLPADFKQALLRLPRNTDPDLLYGRRTAFTGGPHTGRVAA